MVRWSWWLMVNQASLQQFYISRMTLQVGVAQESNPLLWLLGGPSGWAATWVYSVWAGITHPFFSLQNSMIVRWPLISWDGPPGDIRVGPYMVYPYSRFLYFPRDDHLGMVGGTIIYGQPHISLHHGDARSWQIRMMFLRGFQVRYMTRIFHYWGAETLRMAKPKQELTFFTNKYGICSGQKHWPIMMTSTRKRSMGISVQHHSAIMFVCCLESPTIQIGSCGLPSNATKIPYKQLGLLVTAQQPVNTRKLMEIGYSNTNIPMKCIALFDHSDSYVLVPGDKPRSSS